MGQRQEKPCGLSRGPEGKGHVAKVRSTLCDLLLPLVAFSLESSEAGRVFSFQGDVP